MIPAHLRHTPWGQAQHAEPIGDGGLYSVSTAGHGGIYVPDSLLGHIPPAQRAWAARWSGSEQWYEEDCCWAAVAVAFPAHFPPVAVGCAHETLDHYFPS